jgi:hypothetical protein
MEATQRLAKMTGATATQSPGPKTSQLGPQAGRAEPQAGDAGPQSATQAIESLQRAPRAGWRRRDWLVVVGAGVAGLLFARAVIRSRRD